MFRRILAASSFLLVVLLMLAQVAIAQDNTSKVDVFAGYSWYFAGKQAAIPAGKLTNFSSGYSLSGRYNFNSRWSLAIDAAQHIDKHVAQSRDVYSLTAGPQYRFHAGRATPFVEALIGVQHFNGTNNFASIVGAGVDLKLARWISWRVIQADYVYTNYTPSGFDEQQWHGARLQSGLVLNLFNGQRKPEAPVVATLTLDPEAVLAGEPVKATTSVSGFNPNRALSYTWGGNGPKVTTAAGDIDTTGLTPGSYPVTVSISDNGRGRHLHTASAQGSFTIKERPQPAKPPVISSLTAVPSKTKPGEPVAVNCIGNSPDGHALSYSYTTTSGVINGNSTSATLETSGLNAGSIAITCQLSDDRGLSDSKSTQVEVIVPPALPSASKLDSIAFPDTARPWRVDNAAKAVLDDVALRMQREPAASVVIVGYGSDSKGVSNLASRRALNTKTYLVDEKGLDAARIEVRASDEEQPSADIWILPAGATFDVSNSLPVNSTVKADPSHPAGHEASI